MSILNDRIKERRLASGKTLLDVAEHLGVKEATAQRYESGSIKNIKHETICALADFFNCTPAYLMGWDNSPISSSSISDLEYSILCGFRSLNAEGQEKVRAYIDDLIQTGIYKKHNESCVVSKEA